jgi:hypothetical protein
MRYLITFLAFTGVIFLSSCNNNQNQQQQPSPCEKKCPKSNPCEKKCGCNKGGLCSCAEAPAKEAPALEAKN